MLRNFGTVRPIFTKIVSKVAQDLIEKSCELIRVNLCHGHCKNLLIYLQMIDKEWIFATFCYTDIDIKKNRSLA